MRQLKQSNKQRYVSQLELKQREWYRVLEGSPVEVQWVGEDLWWERFVEQVRFKSGMEGEEVMDGVMVVTGDERG